ncbi:MAG: anhydro-N-acetylmuramic acid kinase, partial [candidate division Zixibacteria bacterium]|nr:anhydro-N-acetylmuramic acid kinase [candidate division Zixibacteria bacterium]
MSLNRIINRRNLTVLGMNSGTSVNSLDMVAVRIVRTDRGVRAKFLAGREKKYPASLRNLILDLADSDKPDLTHTAHLDNILGRFYGRAAADFIGQLARQRIGIDVVASHGQT